MAAPAGQHLPPCRLQDFEVQPRGAGPHKPAQPRHVLLFRNEICEATVAFGQRQPGERRPTSSALPYLRLPLEKLCVRLLNWLIHFRAMCLSTS